MGRDDVKRQITAMMICSRRNGNNSLFSVIMHHVVPSHYVSYPYVSLSMTIGTSKRKTFLSDRHVNRSEIFAFLNSCYA